MQLTKNDAFGNRAIAVFGDSITHGANCPDIPNESYIGILKNTLCKGHGLVNYGFTSVESSMWNAHGRYDEMHQVKQDTPWVEVREPDNLGTYALVADEKGMSLTITLSRRYAYAYIYYTAGPGRGSFRLSCGGGAIEVNAAADTVEPRRAGPLALDGSPLRVETLGGGQIVISGMGYYNDLNGIVVNNYSNNGLRLVGLDDEIIKTIATADTVIFSLGYNDSHFPTEESDFTQKIDVLISAVNQSGAKLYVNDLCWNLPTDNHFRREIKRLADETGAIYIPQADIAARGLLDGVGAHPDVTGHGIVAANLIKAMGLAL